jgi:hypothetical protein
MKRILLLMLLTLAVPIATFANSVDFTNSGGKLSGSNSGLSLSGSVLIAAGALTGKNLGSLTFTTGALTSGSLGMGGIFAGGGSFVITGNGADGIHNGVIFSGTFSGPVTWTEITLANGTHNYVLTGSMTGTWYTGQSVDGATIQLTVNTGKNLYSGSTRISSGDTSIAGIGLRVTTPEPGSLVFFGTGLVGMAAILRRKRSKRYSRS